MVRRPVVGRRLAIDRRRVATGSNDDILAEPRFHAIAANGTRRRRRRLGVGRRRHSFLLTQETHSVHGSGALITACCFFGRTLLLSPQVRPTDALQIKKQGRSGGVSVKKRDARGDSWVTRTRSLALSALLPEAAMEREMLFWAFFYRRSLLGEGSLLSIQSVTIHGSGETLWVTTTGHKKRARPLPCGAKLPNFWYDSFSD